MLTPACHASRWFRTFPLISGRVLAQAAGAALAVRSYGRQQVSRRAGGPAAPAPGVQVPQARLLPP